MSEKPREPDRRYDLHDKILELDELKRAYSDLKARADKLAEAMLEITRDREGFPGAECIRKEDLAKQSLAEYRESE